MTDAVLSKFAEHGILGLIVLVLLYVLRSVYQELKEERAGRLKAAEDYAEKLLSMSDRVHLTVDKMAEQQDQLIGAISAGGKK